jgi:hypothetical protein
MEETNNAPVTLSPEKRKEIAERMATCPFVGTAVATGQLSVFNSPENPLAEIDKIAQLGNLGGGDLGTRVLKLFARGNHSRWLVPAERAGSLVPSGMFSLQFGGSQGAHAGHSGILLGNPDEVGQGRLDQVQFERLTRYADSDGHLSIDSVGDFIAENLKLKQDPKPRLLPAWKVIKDAVQLFKKLIASLRGDESKTTEVFEKLTKLLGEDHLVASAGEWGLLFAFLKNSPNSDEDGDIALSDIEMMFVHKRFPDGWETWKKTANSWIKATLLLTIDAWAAYHHG